jgi:hypothetical protein
MLIVIHTQVQLIVSFLFNVLQKVNRTNHITLSQVLLARPYVHNRLNELQE